VNVRDDRWHIYAGREVCTRALDVLATEHVSRSSCCGSFDSAPSLVRRSIWPKGGAHMCAVQTMQCRRLRWCSHVRCSDHAMPSSSCILHFQNACICFLGYRGPCQLVKTRLPCTQRCLHAQRYGPRTAAIGTKKITSARCAFDRCIRLQSHVCKRAAPGAGRPLGACCRICASNLPIRES
jgi:hypothetical protein